MDADGDSPPFWSQLTTTTFFYPHRRPRQPSPIFNPVVLILTVPILVLVVLFFLVPPFLSHITQILHINSVKQSWDSLIIFLVMFSILCGVFARINDEVPSDAADQQNLNVIQVSDVVRPPPMESVSSSHWYGFSDGKEYGGNVLSTPVRVGDGGGTPPKSPAPPTPPPKSPAPPTPPPPPPPAGKSRRSSRSVPKKEIFEKQRNDDKFNENRSPPPPPPPAGKSRRSSRSVPKKEIFEKQRNDDKFNENRSPPPPQPLQKPVAKSQFPEVKSEIVHRKRSSTTKDIATATASLYSKSHRKKVKTRNIYDAASASENSSPGQSGAAAAAPPPPPPPPPPSKVLQKMFKKSSKNKRVHSVSNTAPPPPTPPPPNTIFNNIFRTRSKSKPFQSSSTTALPPPPPPPSSILNTLFKNGTKSRRFKSKSTTSPSEPPAPPTPEPRRYHPVNAGKPPRPNKTSSYYNESVIIAPPSPFIPMPPPPPSFRLKEMEFVAREDFVKIKSSGQSSQCSSPLPELEDSDPVSIRSEGGDSIGPSVSCPSPDVNAKADNFIARRRDEWRLDKMNSRKEKRKLG